MRRQMQSCDCDKVRHSGQISTFFGAFERVNPRVRCLRQRTGTTAAAAGGTSKAMNARFDYAIRKVLWRDVPKIQRDAVLELHPKHLIEVAVIDFALIAYAQGSSAHETIHRCRVETVHQ